MVQGNPDIRKNSQKGYDAEITSLDILEKLGYEIIYSPEKSKRAFQEAEEKFDNSEISKKMKEASNKLRGRSELIQCKT